MPNLVPMHDLPVTVDLGPAFGRVPGVAIYRHRHPLRGWRYLVRFRLGGYLFAGGSQPPRCSADDPRGEWPEDQRLVDEDAARQFLNGHPDPVP